MAKVATGRFWPKAEVQPVYGSHCLHRNNAHRINNFLANASRGFHSLVALFT